MLTQEVIDPYKTLVVLIHFIEYGLDAPCFASGLHLHAFGLNLDVPLQLPWT